MPLLPGSPAIAAGNVNLIPAGTTTDQRGQPRLLNGKVDIGAFESQGFTMTSFPGSTPQSADIGTNFANPLGVTVTANNPVDPVDGGIVTFIAHPAANGASAIFSASSAVIAGGQASVTAAPDNITGTYQVDAVASGHVRFVRSDQHRHAVHQSRCEYDGRLACSRSWPFELARSRSRSPISIAQETRRSRSIPPFSPAPRRST